MVSSLSLFIFVVLVISYASCDDDSFSLTTSARVPDTCDTKLSLCKVDASKIIGPQGIQGDKGEKGLPGLPGRNGTPGRNGIDGNNGTDGSQGVTGPQGPQGPPGGKGLKGDTGSPGRDGLPGLPGLTGLPGVKGATGPAGTPGTCGCPNDEISKPIVEDPNWGTKENPGTVTCRNAPLETLNNSTYYLNPGPMEVTCDTKTKKTCIKPLIGKVIDYSDTKKPFWISEKVSFKDIYNLDTNQLAILQSQSYTAELTIRYNCWNSKPLGDNSTAPMMLLSWNDLNVGPEPTPTSPFHYFTITDKCEKADKEQWSFTEIQLVSSIAKRLPIIDFYINDVRDEKQQLQIDIIKLCFG